MSAETALYAALSNAAGVTALVGNRVYPDIAPEKVALPCVAWQRSNTEYQALIHNGVPDGEFVTLQVFCMATTRTSADAVADAIVAAAGAAGFYPQNRQALVPDQEDTDFVCTVLDLLHYS